MRFKALVTNLLLFALLPLLGCEKTNKPAEQPVLTSNPADHIHGAGPHGGAVFDWGDAHAEFCVEHPKKEATIYLLQGDVKTPRPIKVEKLLLKIKEPVFEVEMKPLPEKSDPPGTASRFVAVHERFGKEQEFGGALLGEIDGKKFSGDFQEEPEQPVSPAKK